MTVLYENGQVIIKAGTEVPIYSSDSAQDTTILKKLPLTSDVTICVNVERSQPYSGYIDHLFTNDDTFELSAPRGSGGTLYPNNYPISQGANFSFTPQSICMYGYPVGMRDSQGNIMDYYFLVLGEVFDGVTEDGKYSGMDWSTSWKKLYDNKIAYGIYYDDETKTIKLSEGATGFYAPPTISEIQYPDGTIYEVEDKTAREALASKQDKLIAGTNITIDPETNTISSTGGGTGAAITIVEWSE